MAKPRPIYLRDLSHAPPTAFLYCPGCHGEYSATAGDYFWMPAGKAFRCGGCRTLLRLVTARRELYDVHQGQQGSQGQQR